MVCNEYGPNHIAMKKVYGNDFGKANSNMILLSQYDVKRTDVSLTRHSADVHSIFCKVCRGMQRS